jgi:hypothetical protein
LGECHPVGIFSLLAAEGKSGLWKEGNDFSPPFCHCGVGGAEFKMAMCGAIYFLANVRGQQPRE